MCFQSHFYKSYICAGKLVFFGADDNNSLANIENGDWFMASEMQHVFCVYYSKITLVRQPLLQSCFMLSRQKNVLF